MAAHPITLTITARDTEHARRIIEAVARLDGDHVAGDDEIVLTPTGEPPSGHTYRELCDARRAGLLQAVMTRKGLVFSVDALEAYRAARAERRRRPKSNVEDINTHRIRALANAGITPTRSRV